MLERRHLTEADSTYKQRAKEFDMQLHKEREVMVKYKQDFNKEIEGLYVSIEMFKVEAQSFLFEFFSLLLL